MSTQRLTAHDTDPISLVASLDPALLGGRVLLGLGPEQAPRCPAGTRFECLFRQRLALMGSDAGHRTAVESGGAATSYAALATLANRLARHLLARGVQPGDRVGILLKGTPETYASMLAVLAAGAVFVPLDAVFPPDRIAYILSDSGARFAISDAAGRALLPADAVTVIAVDTEAGAIAAQPDRVLTPPTVADDLCYIIYTSGTTGRPKGVQIDHRQFCNFVLVAAEVYGIPPKARMYQGLTIAFDFAVEEIWVPLFAGATLVPAPPGGNLAGEDLGLFLKAARVTALCTVPTLLATLDEDLPDLTYLMVSGEACPADLVARWWRQDRVFLNAYGPTEATVTATLGRPQPGKPMTIGRPLPTYMVLIRDPDTGTFLLPGEAGEIILAGVGLSRGYLNRDDLTAKAFIPDPLRLPNNPGGTLYRTGDLGRVLPSGEVEYLGRIDSQVKIRGYRIELTEIESVLMQTPGVAQAVVDKVEPEPGRAELAGWYSVAANADPVTPQAIHARLKEQLPGFMVPAFLTQLPVIPMLPSGKADRKALPPPKARVAGSSDAAYAPPASETETLLAAVVSEVGKVDNPSVTDDLFDGLGLNSLIIARIAASVRKRRPGTVLAMKDFYLHRSIRSLAELLDAQPAADVLQALAPSENVRLHVPSGLAYVGTGAAQLLIAFLYVWALADISLRGLHWVETAPSLAILYGRSVVMGAGLFALAAALPIAAKWLLLGRCQPERFPIWGLRYFRFWLVRSLMRANPLALFVGTPVFNVYLRLLGARIGRDALILSGQVPACPDLFEVGDRAIVSRTALMSTYRAVSGWIETGPVQIGAGAAISDDCVAEPNTRIGDGAALAHTSTLYTGQQVPAGQSWYGSPAGPAPHDYRLDTARAPVAWRKSANIGFQVLLHTLVTMPLPYLLLIGLDGLSGANDGVVSPFNTVPLTVLNLVLTYGGTLLFSMLVAVVGSRLLSLLLQPGRQFPLHGLQHTLIRWVEWFGNPAGLNMMFGDSSLIVYVLRAAGVRTAVDRASQTGSNFGLEQRFDIPCLCTLGPATMASDGLTMQNIIYASDSLKVEPAAVGTGSFIGNSVLVPALNRLGDNVLLATKVFVPVHGPVRENVGLLGSPPFEIPRSVSRDQVFAHEREPERLAVSLARKLRSNMLTIGLFLLSQFVMFALMWVFVAAVLEAYPVYGSVVAPVASFGLVAVALLVSIWLEHAATGFRGLSPKYCSIYDPAYWRHERYWKLTSLPVVGMAGTPFLPLYWRLCGARVGKRVFDDGCILTERSLTEIGDDATINAMAVLQPHSLEDGVFKSAPLTIGKGVTIGTRVFVHYDTVIGDHATLAADSFLMKGEVMGCGEHWGGNPARRLS